MVKTDVSIDKLCIRYAYDGSSPQAKSEFKQLQQFKESVQDGSLGAVGKTWYSKKAAITSMALPLASGAKLFVRYGYVHKRTWSWIGFNPSRLSEEDKCRVSACMDLLFTHGTATLWGQGCITRVDIAVDAKQVTFEDCLFLDRRLRTSQHQYDVAGSTYLGSKDGQKTILAYDKAKERWDKAKASVGHPWLRVEARLFKPMAMHDMFDIGNPFATLLVVDRDALLAIDCKMLDPIRARVAHGEPLDRVYWEFPSLARNEIWGLLQNVRASWWDPKAIWQEYETALAWAPELFGPAMQSIAKAVGGADQLAA